MLDHLVSTHMSDAERQLLNMTQDLACAVSSIFGRSADVLELQTLPLASPGREIL